MDFLKDFALPQPLEHYQLLLVMLGLVGVVLVPYVAFLLGTSYLSLRYRRRGEKDGQEQHLRLAKDLIGLTAHDPRVLAFLGVIPALSMVFLYAQLMQSTPAYSVQAAGYSLVFLLVGGVLLSVYRRAFDLSSLLNTHHELLKLHKGSRSEIAEIASLQSASDRRKILSGRYGFIAVFFSGYFLVASFVVTSDPSLWTRIDSLFELLLCGEVYLKVFQFLALTAGVTGSGLLFFFIAWDDTRIRKDDAYAALIQRIGIRLTIISVLLQPVFLVIGVVVLPSTVLSGVLFALAGIALMFLFLTAQYVYALYKEAKPKYASYAFVSLIVATGLIVTNEQIAISKATKAHAVVLALESERATEDLKTSLGISLVTFNGEDIYNAKCSACHLPDERKVGPPFRLVVKKYEGRRDALVSFIRNPSKVDPAYPPMPNQGLKPAEADSITSYLLRNFLEGQSVEASARPEGP